MVIKRAASDLNFVKTKDPLPTVEVQVDSLEALGMSFPSIACDALAKFAKKNPKVRSTIRLYGSLSTNFHKYGWSEFLAVAGPIKVLQALYEAFSRISGVKCRYSDYIDSKQGRRVFHVEDGRLWEIQDATTWISLEPCTESEAASQEQVQEAVEESEDEPLVETASDLDESELNDSEDAEVTRRQPQGVRFRAARSDARIESIQQAIEETFGLPEGSVALCGPDGRPLRRDALIRTLRRRWEDA